MLNTQNHIWKLIYQKRDGFRVLFGYNEQNLSNKNIEYVLYIDKRKFK